MMAAMERTNVARGLEVARGIRKSLCERAAKLGRDAEWIADEYEAAVFSPGNENVARALVRDSARPDIREFTMAQEAAKRGQTREDVVAERRAVTERVKQETRQAVMAGVASIVRHVVTLSMIMPNGKRLCDCYGPDLIGMGGWITALGGKLKPGYTVGDTFDSDEAIGKFVRERGGA